MQDSKFIKHLCRIIVTPVQNYACAMCAIGNLSDWSNSLVLWIMYVSWTLHWCTWTANLVWSYYYFPPLFFSCFLEAWKKRCSIPEIQNNKNIWDDTKRLSAHLYSLWSFLLSYISLTVNLRVNMGTNVQNFFSCARTFNRWIFKHVLFTGKCRKKTPDEGEFFSSFVRQRIVLFWVLVRMKYDKTVPYLLNVADCQGLSCGEHTSNIIMC